MDQTPTKKLISIVSPAYNECKNLPQLISETSAIINDLKDRYDFEYILVDDGSTDDTWTTIESLSQKYSWVKGIALSRNFGHQIALTAGLDAADGDAVIYCDSDLQHPPEIFKKLIQKWEEGFKVVHTVRIQTEGETYFKRTMSELFYKFINMLSDVRIEKGMADFKLLDRAVLDKLRSMREHNRFLRGMVPWIGFKPAYIEYTARKRLYGKPWYSFRRNLTFAKTGILSFSIKPLKYIGYLGIVLTLFASMALIFDLAISVYVGGWFFSPVVTLTIFNILLFGVVLSSLGIMSLYLSYIYYEVIDRPLYIIDLKTV